MPFFVADSQHIEPGRVSRTVLPFLLLLLLCLCDSSIVNVVMGRVYSESRKFLGFRTRLRRYNTPAVRRSVIIWRPHFQSRISLAPYSVGEGVGDIIKMMAALLICVSAGGGGGGIETNTQTCRIPKNAHTE